MTAKLNLAGFTKEYVVDIPEIDEQHETFFDMLGRIGTVTPDMYKALDEDEADEVVDILAELRDYALLHFHTEESYMKEVNYPEIETQREEHNHFISNVIRMEAELMNGAVIPTIKVYNFMHDWYRDHIMKHDKPFGEFYSKNSK